MEINEKKGRLTLIKKGSPKALFKCDCGNTKLISLYNVSSGLTISCGCYSKEHPHNLKHGDRYTRLYGIWKGIRERCNTPSSTAYARYGAVGITVCKEWDDYSAFKEWAMSHGCDDNLTIDRIDSTGNYEPSNCRWATYKEQANNLRTNRLITHNGQTKTMTQWADETGIKAATIWARLKRGWSIERTLTTH